MPDRIGPFFAVVAVLTLTPGPDMALVLRNGVRGGARAAWWTGLGCCTGIACWALAATGGLSALVVASHSAFTVVKVIGGVYLAYLGVSALRQLRQHVSVSDVTQAATDDWRAAYRQGLATNLLNPKIALIFLTLLPQFVAAGEPVGTTTAKLAGAFLVTAVVWWRVFSLAVGALGRLLSRPRVRMALEGVTGVVLIGLGVRVVLLR
ncbi:MAG TPA: LysE family translocator [Gaiellaceae bacterium]|jgi:threonine/homoserine/homoserine lactone efflux protein